MKFHNYDLNPLLKIANYTKAQIGPIHVCPDLEEFKMLSIFKHLKIEQNTLLVAKDGGFVMYAFGGEVSFHSVPIVKSWILEMKEPLVTLLDQETANLLKSSDLMALAIFNTDEQAKLTTFREMARDYEDQQATYKVTFAWIDAFKVFSFIKISIKSIWNLYIL
jgi:hypothetical protein